MEETHICVVDRDGKIILEARTSTAPKTIAAVLAKGEARAMMVTDELDECRGVRFPIFRKALQIFENGVNRLLGRIYFVLDSIDETEEHSKDDTENHPHLCARCGLQSGRTSMGLPPHSVHLKRL